MFSGIGGFELGIQNSRRFLQGEESEDIQNMSDSKKRSKRASRSNDKQAKGVQQGRNDEGMSGVNRSDVSPEPLCIGYSEVDKYARKIYEKHFSHKGYGDARGIIWEEVDDFEMFVGGFPCQAFSIAGKRGGFQDTRGTLFFEIARAISAKRPKLLLLENVKGLLSHDNGRTFGTILSTLFELGYFCEWQVLNSTDFGVPQNRERVFIIGHLGGGSRGKVFPITGDNGKNGIKRLGNMQGFRRYNQTYNPDGIVEAMDTSGGGGHQPCIPVLTPDRPEKKQNGRRFKEDGDPSFTLTAQDKHGILIKNKGVVNDNGELKEKDIANCLDSNYGKGIDNHSQRTGILDGVRIRRLTPRECERLQGFPDDWTSGISDTQRYKCIGNAVTVNVIEAIFNQIIKQGVL